MIPQQEATFRWVYLSTFATAALQLLSSATITRFLLPRDYGHTAMALLCANLTGCFTQIETGGAVIRKDNLTKGNIRVAFTLSLATGIFGVIALVLLSHLLANYFHEPRLCPIIIAISFNLLLQATAGFTAGLLRRYVHIRELALCDIGS